MPTPMPRHLVPMSAQLSGLPRDDEAYGFEIKLDGVRAVAYVAGGTVVLESRNLRDITPRYPEVGGIVGALQGKAAVLDGEIVAVDDDGRPRFQLLQKRMHVADPSAVRHLMRDVPVAYLVFDVLWLEGERTMDLPYVQRREALEGLGLSGAAWQVPAWHRGDGPALLQATRARGLEGLMAKRLDSPYVPGTRSKSWLKVKNVRRQELVVGGWCPGSGNRENRIGALMVGYYEHGDGVPKLRYAGNVGTGYTDAELLRLAEMLGPLSTAESPFDPSPPRRRAQFVTPALVAEIEFVEWTRDGTLRAPSYKGLRTDKNPHDVVREEVS